MQVKIVLTVLFLFVLTFVNSQTITYTTTIKHSECSGSNNGSAQINVTSTNGPYSFSWSNGDNGNSVSDLSPGSYTVVITDNSSYSTSVTIAIQEIQCNFKAALIFSPNGDGIFDTWQIDGLSDFSDNLVIVYNRMGQKVFESKGTYTPWDGEDLFGKPLPDATYYYLIYSNKKNKKPDEKGSVSILR